MAAGASTLAVRLIERETGETGQSLVNVDRVLGREGLGEACEPVRDKRMQEHPRRWSRGCNAGDDGRRLNLARDDVGRDPGTHLHGG